MTPDQNLPVDPAALAAAAETKVLPRGRFPTDPDLRPMTPDETLTTSDFWGFSDSAMPLSTVKGLAGQTVAHNVAHCETFTAFRPIDPVPHTEGRKVDPETCAHENVTMVCLDCQPAPEAVILANINMDPNVSDAFKVAMGAAVRGAHAKAVEIEKGASEGSSPKAPAQIVAEYVGRTQDDECVTKYEVRFMLGESWSYGYMWKESHAHHIVAAVNSYSTLTDALTKAREALDAAKGVLETAIADVGPFDAVGSEEVQDALVTAIGALESPALVQALKGGEA